MLEGVQRIVVDENRDWSLRRQPLRGMLDELSQVPKVLAGPTIACDLPQRRRQLGSRRTHGHRAAVPFRAFAGRYPRPMMEDVARVNQGGGSCAGHLSFHHIFRHRAHPSQECWITSPSCFRRVEESVARETLFPYKTVMLDRDSWREPAIGREFQA